ncbi:hypothetical protein ACHAPA_001758 [Fusarium lateritium]
MNLNIILLVLVLQLGIVLAGPFEPSGSGVRHVRQQEHGNECDNSEECSVHVNPNPLQSLYKGLVKWIAEKKTARTEDVDPNTKGPLETPVIDWASACKKTNLRDGLQSEHKSMVDHAEDCHRQALEIISSPKGEFMWEMASGHTDIVVNPRVMPKLTAETVKNMFGDEFGDEEEDEMTWPDDRCPKYMWYFKPKEGKRYSIRSPEQTIDHILELEGELMELEQRMQA